MVTFTRDIIFFLCHLFPIIISFNCVYNIFWTEHFMHSRLSLKDYYPVIEHTTEVLEHKPDNVKVSPHD